MNFGLTGYLMLGCAVIIGLLTWRNWSLGNERDAALKDVGALQVVVKQQQANIDYAVGTVEKWKTAQELFGEAVEEQSRVTYLASAEGRKINDGFRKIDNGKTEPRELARLRTLGWNRLNCLLKSGAGRGRCPAGPSAAGEAEITAPATP